MPSDLGTLFLARLCVNGVRPALDSGAPVCPGALSSTECRPLLKESPPCGLNLTTLGSCLLLLRVTSNGLLHPITHECPAPPDHLLSSRPCAEISGYSTESPGCLAARAQASGPFCWASPWPGVHAAQGLCESGRSQRTAHTARVSRVKRKKQGTAPPCTDNAGESVNACSPQVRLLLASMAANAALYY